LAGTGVAAFEPGQPDGVGPIVDIGPGEGRETAGSSYDFALGCCVATKGSGGGSETFYRGMSNAEFDGLGPKGQLSPRGESFVTQDLGYVQQLAKRHPDLYERIVRYDMAPGTRQALIDNGARDRVLSHTLDEAGLGGLPIIGKGDRSVVHVKGEGGAINFGLRPGSADTFNCRILGFCTISGGG
jgi:hypothetical protein